MPGGFSLHNDICNGQNVGSVLTTSFGTVVTSSATANTKGAYTQLIAATASDAAFMEVRIYVQNSNSPNFAIDIAVGASGSEVVLVPNLVTQTIFAGYNLVVWAFPISIPAGTRIAARMQDSSGSQTATVSLTLFDAGFTMPDGYSGVDAIGFTATSTEGTSLTPSTTVDTMGAYSQLIAATTRDYVGIFGAFDSQQGNSKVQSYLVDVAIGASGSEQIIIPKLFNYNSDSNNWMFQFPFHPIQIPAGTRIAARCQTNATSGSGNQRPIDLTLYGVYL